MGKHIKSNARDIRKSGLYVSVDSSRKENLEDRDNENRNNLDHAMRVLKKRMTNEGVIKIIREKEGFISKGQKRRKAKQDAVLREKIRRGSEDREWGTGTQPRSFKKKAKERN